MTVIAKPERDEAARYYYKYIDLVPEAELLGVLTAQSAEVASFLRTISDERSLHRYAPGKWSIRDVVGHINDTERLFVFRAFWFARGFDTPLPSFEQDIAVAHAAADDRSWGGLIDEFESVRAASITFFRDLPADAWLRRGVASDNPFTVRALAYIVAGHVAHHVKVTKERYL